MIFMLFVFLHFIGGRFNGNAIHTKYCVALSSAHWRSLCVVQQIVMRRPIEKPHAQRHPHDVRGPLQRNQQAERLLSFNGEGNYILMEAWDVGQAYAPIYLPIYAIHL